MKIRNYKDEDFPQLIKLLEESGVIWKLTDNRESLNKKIEFEPESIIVAEEEGKIIGTIFLIFDPWCSFIHHAAVDKDYRRKGIGDILGQMAEQRLKARGAKVVCGFVKEGNPELLEIYKRRGCSASKVFFMIKSL